MTNSTKYFSVLLVVVALSAATASCATAQVLTPVRDVIAQSRTSEAGPQLVLGEFVRTRQAKVMQPARLDSLADALVEIAVNDEARSGVRAVTLLAESSSPTSRRRYSGASQRLMRVYREATTPGLKAVALESLGTIGRPAEALRTWRSIATSDKPEFASAPLLSVELLCRSEDGRDILRDLFQANSVVDSRAKSQLTLMIRSDFKRGC